MTQLTQSGLEVILRVCGPGEIIGVFSDRRLVSHCSSARAMESSDGARLGSGCFRKTSCLKFPTLRHNIMQIICERLSKMEERFREISTEKVAVRLSKEIVRLLKQVGQSIDGSFEIRLSREELAQLTGTTVFTVSRLLSMWERRGIVRSQTHNRSVKFPIFRILKSFLSSIDQGFLSPAEITSLPSHLTHRQLFRYFANTQRTLNRQTAAGGRGKCALFDFVVAVLLGISLPV